MGLGVMVYYDLHNFRFRVLLRGSAALSYVTQFVMYRIWAGTLKVIFNISTMIGFVLLERGRH